MPVYQEGGDDGPVLHRRYQGTGDSTVWIGYMYDSTALETCYRSSDYLHSAYNDQAGGGPPTAPAYSPWPGGVAVAAGGGR